MALRLLNICDRIEKILVDNGINKVFFQLE